jgi:nucleoside 2-deoxyribosyltransferase
MNEEIIDAEVVETRVSVPAPEGMRKLYLSGPMTGIENYNHELFDRVAAEFRLVGFEVCSPAEFFDGDVTRERKEYMREAMTYILEADTVVLLPGWENSKGARIEAAVAQELDLNMVEYVERDEADEHIQHVVASFTPVDEDEEQEVPGSFKSAE